MSKGGEGSEERQEEGKESTDPWTRCAFGANLPAKALSSLSASGIYLTLSLPARQSKAARGERGEERGEVGRREEEGSLTWHCLVRHNLCFDFCLWHAATIGNGFWFVSWLRLAT